MKTPTGEIRTVEVPWGVTRWLHADDGGIILTLCAHMPVRTVARETGEQDFPDVSAIGVDEYSHKGHRYPFPS